MQSSRLAEVVDSVRIQSATDRPTLLQVECRPAFQTGRVVEFQDVANLHAVPHAALDDSRCAAETETSRLPCECADHAVASDGAVVDPVAFYTQFRQWARVCKRIGEQIQSDNSFAIDFAGVPSVHASMVTARMFKK